MKTKTAIVCKGFNDFQRWCYPRQIRLNKQKLYVDRHGDEYIPVYSKEKLMGIRVNDFETTCLGSSEYNLIKFVKQRLI